MSSHFQSSHMTSVRQNECKIRTSKILHEMADEEKKSQQGTKEATIPEVARNWLLNGRPYEAVVHAVIQMNSKSTHPFSLDSLEDMARKLGKL